MINVSVIVPVYNAAKHIESCIEALLAQSYPSSRYEIIVVDNNSTDGSADLVRKYSQVTLVTERKQGAYAARNRGVTAAVGGILAFTDADCVPCPEWLQHIVTSLSLPEAEVVLGGPNYAAGSSILSTIAVFESESAAHVFSWKVRDLYYGYTNNMAVRRDVFERFGPFREIARGSDTLFIRSVVKDRPADAVRYVPEAAVRHLEISSVPKWLRKKFIYGRSWQRGLNSSARCRNRTFPESLAIVKGVLRRKHCGVLHASFFMFIAAMGTLSFFAGRATTAFAGPDM